MAKHATIGRPPGIRRFLRFSLRSVMLLTLAVAVWLGYELHESRKFQRRLDAVRALSSEVELTASPWSILRFIEPQTYGRRIAAAELPAKRLDEALAILRSEPALHELRVVCDGVEDIWPGWPQLAAALPGTKLLAVVTPLESVGRRPYEPGYADWPQSRSRRRYQRFLAAIEQNPGLPHSAGSFLRLLASEEPWHWSDMDADEYTAFGLPGGSLAEVLIVSDKNLDGAVVLRWAVLLVDGRCVDATSCSKLDVTSSIRDIDGDGRPDLGMEYTGTAKKRPAGLQSLPGDSQLWFALYAIEPTGFRNLLPEDRLKEPHQR